VLIPPEQLQALVQVNNTKLLRKVNKSIACWGMDAEGRKYLDMLETGNKEFTRSKNLLLRNGQVYVPNFSNLRLQFLQFRHDHQLVRHPRIHKTKEILM
jgi:hypothetical protein